MKRRNFFKLLSATPLIPLIPIEKKGDELLLDRWRLIRKDPSEDVVDAVRHIVKEPIGIPFNIKSDGKGNIEYDYIYHTPVKVVKITTGLII